MPPAVRRFGGAATTTTNSLLQKVSSQLGNSAVRNAAGSSGGGGGTGNDDGLGDYLKSLSRKSVTKPDLQWDKFGELDDFSDNEAAVMVVTKEHKQSVERPSTTSKFLKKKASATADDRPASVIGSSKSTIAAAAAAAAAAVPGNKMTVAGRSGQIADSTIAGHQPVRPASSALSKAQAFTSRYGGGSGLGGRIAATELLSDSDLDMNLSMDEDVLADVRAVKGRNESKDVTAAAAAGAAAIGTGASSTAQRPSVATTPQLQQQKPLKPAASFFRPSANLTRSDAEDDDSSSVGIGKAGSKFIKKRVEAPPSAVNQVDTTAVESTSRSKGGTKPKQQQQRSQGTTAPGTTPGSVQGTKVPVLDSDDESLAEFMDQLTSQSDKHRPLTTATTAAAESGSKKGVPARRQSPDSVSLDSVPDSYDTLPTKESISSSSSSASDSESDESIKFNIKDLDSLEFASEPIHYKQHSDNNSSAAITAKRAPVMRSHDRQKSPTAVTAVAGRVRGDSGYDRGDLSLLAHLGLHTIDELLEGGGQGGETGEESSRPVSSEPPAQPYESDFESVAGGRSSSEVNSPVPPTPLRSILMMTPRAPTPKSSRSRVRLMDELNEVRSRSRSPSPVSTARTTEVPEEEEAVDTERSVATVPTLSDDESHGDSTAKDFETRSNSDESTTRGTVSESEVNNSSTDREQLHHARVSRSQHVSRRSSELMTSPGRSESWRLGQRSARSSRRSSETRISYSEDFTATETRDDTRPASATDTDTTQVETRSSMSRTQPRHKKRRSSVKVDATVRDASVQTGVDAGSGLYYSWSVDQPTSGLVDLQYRLAFADPTSVAATVVSANDLEAMTSYNPSMVALNDLLKQQVQLTRQFVDIQSRLHSQLITSLNSSASVYQYTTLEDTKEYIRKHKRPVVTFEEALKHVQQEMGLSC